MTVRRWLALFTALGLSIGGLAFARTPPRYRGTATLEMTVEVPAALLKFAPLEEYMQNMYAHWPGAVLDGNPLEQVANEFGLYARERRELSFGDFVGRFRNDIILSALSGNDPTVRRFTLSFESNDPQTAMKVAARLASVLVEHAEEADSKWNKWLWTPPARARFRLVDPGTTPRTHVRLSSLPYLGGGLAAGLASGLGTLPLLLWWRRRQPVWLKWGVAGALLGALSGWGVYRVTSPIFQAHTRVGVLPRRYGASLEEARALPRDVNLQLQLAFSRAALEGIIRKEHLYEQERRQMWMDDVVARMRRDIEISPRMVNLGTVQSFTIGFRHSKPRTAMRVTELLASRLIMASRDGCPDSIELMPVPDCPGEDRYGQFRITDGARLPVDPVAPRLVPYLTLGAIAGLALGFMVSLWHTERAA